MSCFKGRLSARFSLCTAAACLALWPAPPAFAGAASFGIPIYAVHLRPNALLFQTEIRLVPDGEPPANFFINFVLPNDYKENGTVKIALYLQNSGTPTCRVPIAATRLIRKRIGAPVADNLAGLSSGPFATLPLGNVAAKLFDLAPGGPMPGQMPGDAFVVQFTRHNEPVRQCVGHVILHAIEIRYETP
jgi:hypothetical protein